MAIFNIKNFLSDFKAKFSKKTDKNIKNDSNYCQSFLKILRVLVAITCLSCYILSMYYTTEQFFEYNTVVTTEYVKYSYLPLPAMTACVPFAISFSQLCRKLNYTANQTDCYRNMKNTWTITSIDDFVTSLTVDGEMGLVQSYHTDQYLTSGPLMKLIDFSLFRTVKLNCVAATEKVKTSYVDLDYFSKSNCDNSSQVFSLIYNNKKIGRSAQLCQTFFSHYDPHYDENQHKINLKLNSNKMAFFKFELLSSWFPPEHKQEGISISIHPPNLIPSDLDFKFFSLKANKSYEIEYEREVSVLLPPPYKTMCDNYGSDEVEGISKIDCIRLCVYRNSWDEKRKCRKQWNVILLNELDRNERLCSFDDTTEEDYLEIREQCEEKCRKSCVEQDYNVKLEVIDDDFDPFNVNGNEDSDEWSAFANINDITIVHHTGPELIITHNVDMTFTEFMADVGGLGGVYLGLSIFALYNYLVTFLGKSRKFLMLQSNTEKPKRDSILFHVKPVENNLVANNND